MTVHDVKILPEHFVNVAAGLKTFESRLDDRNYAVGDLLNLREWRNEMYTGRVVEARITDVYRGEHCKEGYCLISFQLQYPNSVMIPMKAFMNLYDLFLLQRNESEKLRRELKELKEVKENG